MWKVGVFTIFILSKGSKILTYEVKKCRQLILIKAVSMLENHCLVNTFQMFDFSKSI